jgi:hypothetical protein
LIRNITKLLIKLRCVDIEQRGKIHPAELRSTDLSIRNSSIIATAMEVPFFIKISVYFRQKRQEAGESINEILAGGPLSRHFFCGASRRRACLPNQPMQVIPVCRDAPHVINRLPVNDYKQKKGGADGSALEYVFTLYCRIRRQVCAAESTASP